MKKFFDVALVDKCNGNLIATWAGLECTFKDALLNLMQRAEGKIPPAMYNLIVLHIENQSPGDLNIRYGYVVRSASLVKEF